MNKKVKVSDIILIIILLILVCLNIIIYTHTMQILETKQKNLAINTNIDEKKEDKVQNEEDDTELEKLKSMSERDRMEFYFSEYATYIEDEKYEKAYNLLYPEFKNNYFPTLDKFEEYVKKIYPKFMAFSYNNIDRQGYIYVLNIDIIDIDNKNNKKSHRVVIQENDFNDFVLSFQVI